MYEPFDPDLAEMAAQRSRRNRIRSIIVVVVVASMLAVYGFSNLFNASRSRTPPVTTVDFVQT
ncbi:MAG: hypothetical protein OEM22_02980 [Acidimicrobiia bacterium]|nr:hypothetical protein [Acidimicrobiia bacterium]MDH3470494.1 hypothetical protein [Acidimicrobiia bacterium]